MHCLMKMKRSTLPQASQFPLESFPPENTDSVSKRPTQMSFAIQGNGLRKDLSFVVPVSCFGVHKLWFV